MFFSMSRLAKLDVKWSGHHSGNEHFYMRRHANPYYELIMVAEGPIYLQIEDAKLVLQSGETLILKPWERHMGWKETHEQANFFWVQFSCDPPFTEIHDLHKGLDSLSHLQVQDLRTSHEHDVDNLLLPRQYRFPRQYELLSMFEALLHTLTNPAGYFRYRAAIQFSQMLEKMAHAILSDNQNLLQIPDSFASYRKLVNLLHEIYDQNLPKEDIETYMDRTYEYLCQIFKRYSGITIVKYIHYLKMQRAKFLLSNTNKSIQEVAQDIGIDDAFYFSKLFKKYEGVNPTEFRAE